MPPSPTMLTTSIIRHSKFVIRHFIFALFLTPCVLPAAPPPELTLLRTQYEKILAERVTAPFEAALGTLNTKFTTALDNAAAEAKKSGSLPAVLAIEADKKRIADKLPLPDADDEQTPESLTKLRAIYREQFKKIDDQRVANHQTILPAYTVKLQALETTLTKADRVDEAKEVLAYRERLVVRSVATATAPAKPAAPNIAAGSAPPADAGPKVSAEEASRQLVEWAVQNGHTAFIRMAKENLSVKLPQDIPKEKFDLLKIEAVAVSREPPPWRLFLFTPNVERLYLDLYNITVAPGDLAMLRNLKLLRSFEFKAKLDDVNLVIEAMPQLPNLTDLIFSHPLTGKGLSMLVHKYPDVRKPAIGLIPEITEEEFAALAGWKRAGLLRFDSLKQPLTEANVEVINKMPEVRKLIFFFPAKVPIDLARAGKLSKITAIDVHYKLPPGSLDGICAVPNLSAIFLRNFAGLSKDDIKSLAAATKVTSLNLEGISTLDDTTLSQIIAGWPNLEELRIVNCAAITPDGLAGLSDLKNLGSVTLGKMPAMTDVVLDHLKGAKKLKNLSLKDTVISDVAIAGFKKARSDVKVER